MEEEGKEEEELRRRGEGEGGGERGGRGGGGILLPVLLLLLRVFLKTFSTEMFELNSVGRNSRRRLEFGHKRRTNISIKFLRLGQCCPPR